MSDEIQTVKLSAGFVKVIAATIETYGEPVVEFGFTSFLVGFLPFLQAIMKEPALIGMARSCGLNEPQTEAALRLMGNLLKANDQHHAWLAAQAIAEMVPSGTEVLWTALTPPEKGTAN